MKSVALALVICAALQAGLVAQNSAQEPAKSFRVQYVAGPANFTGEHVNLTVTSDALVIEGKAGKRQNSVAIPLDGITLVMHSPMRFSRTRQVSPYLPNLPPPSGASGSGPIGGAVDVMMITTWGTYEVARLMTLGIVHSTHGQKHFVTILWQQEGLEREWVVEAGKSDYVPLIEQLERFTGKKWIDLETEYQRFEREIKKQKDNGFSVQLDRAVTLNGEILPSGSYRLVLLERTEGLGDLYFFIGKEITNANLRGAANVEISQGVTDKLEIFYNPQLPNQIMEIRTPARTVRLRQM